MSTPVEFLYSFTRAVATISLYWERHPSRTRAVHVSYEWMQRLLAEDPQPQFSFLVNEVIYNRRAVRELQDWDWTRRLAEAGIQRFEFSPGVSLDEFIAFLEDVAVRLGGMIVPTTAARISHVSPIRFGAVGVRNSTTIDLPAPQISTAKLDYLLTEEAAAVRWIHDEVGGQASLPRLEAEAVVRSLSVAMHGDGHLIAPLLQLKRYDEYTTTHAMNVAVLTMALADSLGYSARDVRAFGTAGLLHDLGKVRVPREILVKPGKLTAEEREILNAHPADGARLILESDQNLGLAAAVAYEHHIMIDGGGYPKLHYPRDCHYGSRLVHVCDVFDALRTDRPYRAAWAADDAVQYIEDRAGTEFDAEIARAFVALMRRIEVRIGKLEDPVAA